MRVAFAGASGTGKTTLAEYVAETWHLPLNPVGSRSVAKAMGFDNPYDVDAAGKRAEFQRRLVTEKCRWESDQEAFVTDRTTLDNIAYTMLHDVHAVDDELLADAVSGYQRYTHVIYCPFRTFFNASGDPNRVKEKVYHELFDVVIEGLITRYRRRSKYLVLDVAELDQRYGELWRLLNP